VIKVDKNIPLPSRPSKGPRKYPWATMKVGESFLSDCVDANSMRSQCRKASKKLNKKFEHRTTDAGIRCWRVA
jgi:hypothetical protein